MSEPVLICVAWPYANADIHVGNMTGSHLPADIVARYHRMRGRDVMMVSGSDAHGTPITVRADAEGSTPEEVYQHFHQNFLEVFQKTGITYDCYTSTHTENHKDVAQKMFSVLKENGYLYIDSQKQWYSPTQERFLPDRYVEGTCYICGFEGARSDQCDNCGNLLESEKLLNPRSKVDGSTPELRETEHFFLDLAKLEPEVIEYLEERKSYWRPNVIRQSLTQIESNPLRGRAITRDLNWGIPVPLKGWDGKALYVWFEAVMGYLSAAVEAARLAGDDNLWRHWWIDPDSKIYNFIGKDNIPFHAIIWPAELIGAATDFDAAMGAENPQPLVLPYDVPSNEFMNMEGRKISGSRNWGVWVLDFLSRYDPDPLRYYLTVTMPETKDSDWAWEEFYNRNNGELIATWGNLANRVLGFAHKRWDGVVPDPGTLTEQDTNLLETIEGGFETVAQLIEEVKLRAALAEIIRLASEVNKYLDDTEPWKVFKEDEAAAGRAIFTAMKAIDSLKTMFAPFLPFTSEKLHGFLNYKKPLFGTGFTQEETDRLGKHTVLRYDASDATAEWKPSELEPGRAFQKPTPLFTKLDPSIVEEELERLGK